MKWVKDWRVWVVFIVGYVALQILFGVVRENNRTNLTAQPTSTADLSPEDRRGAINACIDEGASEVFCTCFVDEIDSRYTLFEMLKLYADKELRDKNEDIMAIGKYCLGEDY